SRRRHTRWPRDWSSDVCSSDLEVFLREEPPLAGRVVLAERVAHEGVVAQQPAQVRMARKVEAEEVERFALEPVRRRPDLGDRGEIGRASCRERGERGGGGVREY